MHSMNNGGRRRATTQEREQKYHKWLTLYQSALSPYEIMDALGISEAQFKAYLTRAICSGDTQAVAPTYRTCRGKELPLDILKQLDVNDKALVKIELDNERVCLCALKPTKEAEANEIK